MPLLQHLIVLPAIQLITHSIIIEYLINLFTIIIIESYTLFVVRFLNLSSLITKFIVTSSHSTVNTFVSWRFLYFWCLAALFCWQHKHFLIYFFTFCLMSENVYLLIRSLIVLLTLRCSAVRTLWCLSMISYFMIFSINILSSFTIKFLSFLLYSFDTSFDSLTNFVIKSLSAMCMITCRDCTDISVLSDCCLRIDATVSTFSFMRSDLWLRVSAHSLFFSDVYTIVNLYCLSCSAQLICLFISFLKVVNCTRFLWSV